MATVTGLTAARMQEIIDTTIANGYIDENGDLILVTYDSSEINAGPVLGTVPDASDSVRGIIEIATNTEAATGSDNERAITPSSLDYVLDAIRAVGQFSMTGEIKMWSAMSPPSGWLLCNGASVSRTIYADLYAVVNPSLGEATVSIASPGVVTKSSHGLIAGDKVFFTTTGALPTGFSTNTRYYVLATGLTADTFRLSTTDGGSAINTSGTQNGIHTLRRCPYGVSSASDFDIPNFSGRSPIGVDSSQSEFAVLGKNGGAKTHTLTSAEMPVHTHTQNAHSHGFSGTGALTDGSGNSLYQLSAAAYYNFYTAPTSNATATNQNTGGGGSHNNLHPYLSINYIIKI